MRNSYVLAAVVLLGILGFSTYPSVHAWSSSPQITASVDGSGNTVLTIAFDFTEMADPPTSFHFPTEFQVRTSTDGTAWTELSPFPLSPTPTTTKFTVTYNMGKVSGALQVQARLNCSAHGWSIWGPDPAIAVPELSLGTAGAILAVLTLGSLILLKRNRRAISN